ncbi:hypothetical protein HWI79_2193 [Cryptosporidium felis]|nr:hypothetical protein HWI79_2193 [Cryptosporidium felis]
MVVLNLTNYSSYKASHTYQRKGYISGHVFPFLKIFKDSTINLSKNSEFNKLNKTWNIYNEFYKEDLFFIIKILKFLLYSNQKVIPKKWLINQMKMITSCLNFPNKLYSNLYQIDYNFSFNGEIFEHIVLPRTNQSNAANEIRREKSIRNIKKHLVLTSIITNDQNAPNTISYYPNIILRSESLPKYYNSSFQHSLINLINKANIDKSDRHYFLEKGISEISVNNKLLKSKSLTSLKSSKIETTNPKNNELIDSNYSARNPEKLAVSSLIGSKKLKFKDRINFRFSSITRTPPKLKPGEFASSQHVNNKILFKSNFTNIQGGTRVKGSTGDESGIIDTDGRREKIILTGPFKYKVTNERQGK